MKRMKMLFLGLMAAAATLGTVAAPAQAATTGQLRVGQLVNGSASMKIYDVTSDSHHGRVSTSTGTKCYTDVAPSTTTTTSYSVKTSAGATVKVYSEGCPIDTSSGLKVGSKIQYGVRW